MTRATNDGRGSADPLAAHHRVHEYLDIYRRRLRFAMGDRPLGVYLHGSLALEAFDPETSDVDVVVVLDGTVTDADLAPVSEIHRSLPPCPAYSLEVSYMSANVARRWDPRNCGHLEFDSERLKAEPQGPDSVFMRHVAREKGVVLAGPAASEFFDPIHPDDLRSAARRTLANWWRPMLDPASTYHRLLSDDPLYQTYGILTMCRALCTIRVGDVVSKPVAAAWALQAVDRRWHDLIEGAQAWRPGMPAQDAATALAFIGSVVEAAATAEEP